MHSHCCAATKVPGRSHSALIPYDVNSTLQSNNGTPPPHPPNPLLLALVIPFHEPAPIDAVYEAFCGSQGHDLIMESDPPLHRRRKPTKRRGRTRLSSLPSSPPPSSSAPNPASSDSRPDRKPPASLSIRAATPARKRKGLRAPPTIPGYETAPVSTSPEKQRYTPETIAELKRKGNNLPPPVSDVAADEQFVPNVEGKGGSKTTSLEDAELALREAKLGENSAKFKEDPAGKGASDLVGAQLRPDPFSAEWRDATIGRANVVAEDDVVVVDDFTGVTDAEYIPLEGDAVMKDADATGDAEEEGSDGEWELEQLRRAGHGVQRDADAIAQEKARQIVREADERRRRGGGFSACLRAAREATLEWVARQELAEGKMRQMEQAERSGSAVAVEIDGEIAGAKRRLAFYGALSAHVDDVVDMLKEKEADIVAARGRFLERLAVEAEAVKTCLHGGTDEFGRSRLPSLEVPEAEAEAEAGEDVLEDVMSDVRSIESLIVWFRKWRTQYPKEYEDAFGDAGLGKLAGRIALATQSEDLEWVKALRGMARAEALRASKAVETVAAGIRARWKPRDEESGRRYAGSGREVVEAYGEEGKRAITDAFRERMGWESECCRKVGSATDMWKCVEESVRVISTLKLDFGMVHLLRAVEEEGWDTDLWDGCMKEAVRSIAEDEAGVVSEGGIALAKKLLADVSPEVRKATSETLP
ncbi:unnamed protein product [Chondrus crispus]|uniref:GCF C-terminal domain-containing protein n=1 Tax=Chondrus crispus TaxID=2769 RepID=R7QRU5_CHOCR|nr:unnamed protein product [Chondrus crispus]CDF40226.1 unnamed protein product [Chondrus crispus]|eukprot:XP_005710520.1 unnamed protein product [Chondrus crispus]